MYSRLLVSSRVAFCSARALDRLALDVKMIAPLHSHNHLIPPTPFDISDPSAACHLLDPFGFLDFLQHKDVSSSLKESAGG